MAAHEQVSTTRNEVGSSRFDLFTVVDANTVTVSFELPIAMLPSAVDQLDFLTDILSNLSTIQD